MSYSNFNKLTRQHLEQMEKCPLLYKYLYIDKIQPGDNTGDREFSGNFLVVYSMIEEIIIAFHKALSFTGIKNKADIKREMLTNMLDDYFQKNKIIKNISNDAYDSAALMLKNYYELFLPEQIDNIIIKEFLNAQIADYRITSLINRIDLNGENADLIFFKVGGLPGDPAALINYELRYQLAAFSAKQNNIYKTKKIFLNFLFLESGKSFRFFIDQETFKSFERRIKEVVYNISLLESHYDSLKNTAALSDSYIFRGQRLHPEQLTDSSELAKPSGRCSYCKMFLQCAAWKIRPNEMVSETLEKYNERERMSYSKYSGYLNCPFSWKKRYIDKIPSKPRPFFDLGHSIHETFEKFYDAIDKTPRTYDYLLKIYNIIFPKYINGYSDETEKQRYYENGLKMLEKYYKRFGKDIPFKPAFKNEAYFELPLGKYTSLNGYIDRIDKIKENEYVILDYKTEPTNRTQEDIDNDKQLAIYSWAIEKMYGLKTKSVSLFMLEFDEIKTTSFNTEDISELLNNIDETTKKILDISADYKTKIKELKSASGLDIDFEKKKLSLQYFPPNKNKYCKSCDFLDDCPLKQEIMSDIDLISMEK